MIIQVRVIARAKENLVKRIEENEYKVYITSLPEKGKANQVVIKLLAEYFKVSKSSLKIIKGELSRKKIVEIIF